MRETPNFKFNMNKNKENQNPNEYCSTFKISDSNQKNPKLLSKKSSTNVEIGKNNKLNFIKKNKMIKDLISESQNSLGLENKNEINIYSEKTDLSEDQPKKFDKFRRTDTIQEHFQNFEIISTSKKESVFKSEKSNISHEKDIPIQYQNNNLYQNMKIQKSKIVNQNKLKKNNTHRLDGHQKRDQVTNIKNQDTGFRNQKIISYSSSNFKKSKFAPCSSSQIIQKKVNKPFFSSKTKSLSPIRKRISYRKLMPINNIDQKINSQIQKNLSMNTKNESVLKKTESIIPNDINLSFAKINNQSKINYTKKNNSISKNNSIHTVRSIHLNDSPNKVSKHSIVSRYTIEDYNKRNGSTSSIIPNYNKNSVSNFSYHSRTQTHFPKIIRRTVRKVSPILKENKSLTLNYFKPKKSVHIISSKPKCRSVNLTSLKAMEPKPLKKITYSPKITSINNLQTLRGLRPAQNQTNIKRPSYSYTPIKNKYQLKSFNVISSPKGNNYINGMKIVSSPKLTKKTISSSDPEYIKVIDANIRSLSNKNKNKSNKESILEFSQLNQSIYKPHVNKLSKLLSDSQNAIRVYNFNLEEPKISKNKSSEYNIKSKYYSQYKNKKFRMGEIDSHLKNSISKLSIDNITERMLENLNILMKDPQVKSKMQEVGFSPRKFKEETKKDFKRIQNINPVNSFNLAIIKPNIVMNIQNGLQNVNCQTSSHGCASDLFSRKKSSKDIQNLKDFLYKKNENKNKYEIKETLSIIHNQNEKPSVQMKDQEIQISNLSPLKNEFDGQDTLKTNVGIQLEISKESLVFTSYKKDGKLENDRIFSADLNHVKKNIFENYQLQNTKFVNNSSMKDFLHSKENINEFEKQDKSSLIVKNEQEFIEDTQIINNSIPKKIENDSLIKNICLNSELKNDLVQNTSNDHSEKDKKEEEKNENENLRQSESSESLKEKRNKCFYNLVKKTQTIDIEEKNELKFRKNKFNDFDLNSSNLKKVDLSFNDDKINSEEVEIQLLEHSNLLFDEVESNKIESDEEKESSQNESQKESDKKKQKIYTNGLFSEDEEEIEIDDEFEEKEKSEEQNEESEEENQESENNNSFEKSEEKKENEKIIEIKKKEKKEEKEEPKKQDIKTEKILVQPTCDQKRKKFETKLGSESFENGITFKVDKVVRMMQSSSNKSFPKLPSGSQSNEILTIESVTSKPNSSILNPKLENMTSLNRIKTDRESSSLSLTPKSNRIETKLLNTSNQMNQLEKIDEKNESNFLSVNYEESQKRSQDMISHIEMKSNTTHSIINKNLKLNKSSKFKKNDQNNSSIKSYNNIVSSKNLTGVTLSSNQEIESYKSLKNKSREPQKKEKLTLGGDQQNEFLENHLSSFSKKQNVKSCNNSPTNNPENRARIISFKKSENSPSNKLSKYQINYNELSSDNDSDYEGSEEEEEEKKDEEISNNRNMQIQYLLCPDNKNMLKKNHQSFDHVVTPEKSSNKISESMPNKKINISSFSKKPKNDLEFELSNKSNNLPSNLKSDNFESSSQLLSSKPRKSSKWQKNKNKKNNEKKLGYSNIKSPKSSVYIREFFKDTKNFNEKLLNQKLSSKFSINNNSDEILNEIPSMGDDSSRGYYSHHTPSSYNYHSTRGFQNISSNNSKKYLPSFKSTSKHFSKNLQKIKKQKTAKILKNATFKKISQKKNSDKIPKNSFSIREAFKKVKKGKSKKFEFVKQIPKTPKKTVKNLFKPKSNIKIQKLNKLIKFDFILVNSFLDFQNLENKSFESQKNSFEREIPFFNEINKNKILKFEFNKFYDFFSSVKNFYPKQTDILSFKCQIPTFESCYNIDFNSLGQPQNIEKNIKEIIKDKNPKSLIESQITESQDKNIIIIEDSKIPITNLVCLDRISGAENKNDNSIESKIVLMNINKNENNNLIIPVSSKQPLFSFSKFKELNSETFTNLSHRNKEEDIKKDSDEDSLYNNVQNYNTNHKNLTSCENSKKTHKNISKFGKNKIKSPKKINCFIQNSSKEDFKETKIENYFENEKEYFKIYISKNMFLEIMRINNWTGFKVQNTELLKILFHFLSHKDEINNILFTKTEIEYLSLDILSQFLMNGFENMHLIKNHLKSENYEISANSVRGIMNNINSIYYEENDSYYYQLMIPYIKNYYSKNNENSILCDMVKDIQGDEEEPILNLIRSFGLFHQIRIFWNIFENKLQNQNQNKNQIKLSFSKTEENSSENRKSFDFMINFISDHDAKQYFQLEKENFEEKKVKEIFEILQIQEKFKSEKLQIEINNLNNSKQNLREEMIIKNSSHQIINSFSENFNESGSNNKSDNFENKSEDSIKENKQSMKNSSFQMKSSHYLKKLLAKKPKTKFNSINDSFCIKDNSSLSNDQKELSDINTESEAMSFMNHSTLKPNSNSQNPCINQDELSNEEKTVYFVNKMFFMVDDYQSCFIYLNGKEQEQLKDIKEKYNVSEDKMQKIQRMVNQNLQMNNF